MKTKTMFDEVYGARILLVWDCSPEQFTRLVRGRFDKKYDGDSDFNGRCLEYQKPCQTIVICLPVWRRSDKGVSVLAHECFHATRYILSYHDIELSDGTEEAYAYFLDSLVRRCLEILP